MIWLKKRKKKKRSNSKPGRQHEPDLPKSQWAGWRLTGENVSHDGVPEEGHVVDDVPEALEVGQQVVDRVGRRLQGRFDPREELGWKRRRAEK